jgi:hypothetical protein
MAQQSFPRMHELNAEMNQQAPCHAHVASPRLEAVYCLIGLVITRLKTSATVRVNCPAWIGLFGYSQYSIKCDHEILTNVNSLAIVLTYSDNIPWMESTLGLRCK